MIYVFLALSFYTATIMTGALASRIANTSLVTAIENVISAVIPIIVAIPLLNKKVFVSEKAGIWLAVLVGIFIALFTLFINKAYSQNKVAIVAPVVFGGAIFLTAILSSIFFKEKVSVNQGIGLVLLGLGLAFIIYARFTGR